MYLKIVFLIGFIGSVVNAHVSLDLSSLSCVDEKGKVSVNLRKEVRLELSGDGLPQWLPLPLSFLISELSYERSTPRLETTGGGRLRGEVIRVTGQNKKDDPDFTIEVVSQMSIAGGAAMQKGALLVRGNGQTFATQVECESGIKFNSK